MALDQEWKKEVVEKFYQEEELKEEKKYPLKLNSYKWSNLKVLIKAKSL